MEGCFTGIFRLKGFKGVVAIVTEGSHVLGIKETTF
jgi:hypothetical protein